MKFALSFKTYAWLGLACALAWLVWINIQPVASPPNPGTLTPTLSWTPPSIPTTTQKEASPNSPATAISAGMALRFATASNFRVFVEYAKQHPEQGGLYYAREALIKCDTMLQQVFDNKKQFNFNVSQTDGLFGQRQKVFEFWQQRCQGFLPEELSQKAIRELEAKARALKDSLQVRLDEYWAIDHSAQKKLKIQGQKDQLALIQDPYLFYDFGLRINSQSDQQSATFWLDGKKFPFISTEGQDMRTAWKLTACTFGMACDIGHRDVSIACINFGRCVESLEALYRAGYLSEGDNDGSRFNRVLTFRDRIVDVIKSGDVSAFHPRNG